MRQYWAAWALAFAACGSPSGSQIDASTGSGSNHPPQCNPPPGPRCPSTCGNGVVDTCYAQGGENCEWAPMTETCDGSSASCSSLGYLGDGTATCTHSCQFDASSCLSCVVTSTVLECDSLATAGLFVASGSELAFAAGSVTRYGHDTNGALALLGSSGTGLGTLVATPAGWIAAGEDGALATLDANGAIGTFSTGKNAPTTGEVLGATTDRVIEVWEAFAMNTLVVSYRIADATAAIVVPTATLATEHVGTAMRVTSDGSSFFVLAAGQVARIATDGSVVATTPYPAVQTGWPNLFAWGTTGGWFAGKLLSDGSYIAQRFDATGALVGAAIAIPASAQGFGIDGDDLLEVVSAGAPSRLRIDRITPAGAVTESPDIGFSAYPAPSSQIVRFGADLVVVWRGAGTDDYLARVAF